MRQDAARREAMRHASSDAARCGAARCSAARCGAARSGAARSGKNAYAASPASKSIMASNSQDVLLALAYRNRLIALTLLEMENNQRTHWVRKLWQTREEQGHYNNLIQEMRLHDHSMHFNYLRMLPSTFDDLLRLIGPTLVKKTSRFREPLPPALRLAVALRYLAAGETQASLSYNFRIGRSTVCQILKEVPEKIWEILSPIAVKVPEREDEWKRLAKDFWNLWGFPNCLGAIDGKHCVITCPHNSGGAFYNHKGLFSIVLFAVADASYMFTYVDVGDYSRQCDQSSVLNNSRLGKALENNTLNLPNSDFLPGTTANARYCFIGGEAFPLRENLQRPYPGNMLSEKRCIYNYRLSRARRVVENAFGILSARWRFLKDTIQAEPEKAGKFVLAAIALHNWLKKYDDTQTTYGRIYCPPGYTDYEDSRGMLHKGIWRSEIGDTDALTSINQIGNNNYTKVADALRSRMADYFVSPQGELPWQKEYVRRTSYEPV